MSLRPDLVLHGARIVTLDARRPLADWVAISGGRILAVGGRGELDAIAGGATRRLDCNGATVLPGFNDAHCHPIALAWSRLAVDCSAAQAPSVQAVVARIRERAGQTTPGGWVRAGGFDDELLAERRDPTSAELDAASDRHPIILLHATGQRCVLNGAARALAQAGRVAAGVGLAPLDEAEIELGMRLVDRECLSHGITSLQDTSWSNDGRHWQTWSRLVARGVFRPRVTMLAGTPSLAEFRAAGLATGSGDARLRLGGFKLALDESTGVPNPAQEDIDALALEAARAGFQVAFHVSDLPMLEAALAAMAAVRARLERPPGFRLEHCLVCPPALLRRVAASGAVVATQPGFLETLGERYRPALAEREGWFLPLRSLRRFGATIAFGSDAPLAPLDPLRGIRAAVARRTDASRPLGPREAVTLREALEMQTLGAAHAALEQDAKGRIVPGQLADLVVLDGDLDAQAPEQLAELRVRQTIIAGEIVWEA